MKLTIIGDGAFGSFLKELLSPHFEIVNNADSVILAVPISVYDEVASQNKNKHLINVCSVQKPSTDICLKHSDRVTGLHPLFGRRTPSDRRNSILSYSYNQNNVDNDTWFHNDHDAEINFLQNLQKHVNIKVSQEDSNKKLFTPMSHDLLMAKTHYTAMLAAKQLKVFTDRVKDIPDEHLPNSFRLMKDFVKTLDDMPIGTVESIMANPYI